MGLEIQSPKFPTPEFAPLPVKQTYGTCLKVRLPSQQSGPGLNTEPPIFLSCLIILASEENNIRAVFLYNFCDHLLSSLFLLKLLFRDCSARSRVVRFPPPQPFFDRPLPTQLLCLRTPIPHPILAQIVSFFSSFFSPSKIIFFFCCRLFNFFHPPGHETSEALLASP